MTLTKYNETAFGYCANVALKNNTSATIPSWSVVYDTGTATDWFEWFATFSSVGNVHTVKGVLFPTIAPGATRTFGFCANYHGAAVAPVIKSVNSL